MGLVFMTILLFWVSGQYLQCDPGAVSLIGILETSSPGSFRFKTLMMKSSSQLFHARLQVPFHGPHPQPGILHLEPALPDRLQTEALILTVPQKSNLCVALHLEVAAAYQSTPHAAEICAP
jgi:hypothetical protein